MIRSLVVLGLLVMTPWHGASAEEKKKPYTSGNEVIIDMLKELKEQPIVQQQLLRFDKLMQAEEKKGGNATGVNMFITAIEAKRLGLLHELVPSARQIAVILNPNSPEIDRQLSDLQTAAQAIGLELQIFRVSAETEFEPVFATLAQNACEPCMAVS